MRCLWLMLPGLLISSGAQALSMDYYTYDGFSETVTAFQRMALVFANSEYTVLFFVACILGIFFGGVLMYTRMMLGQQGSNLTLTWLITVLLGVAVYKGLVTPTGSLHIYDPVRNQYQEVSGIPDIIVAVTGFSNKLERAVQRITDTASAYPYANEGGGISFKAIISATTDATQTSDYYLFKSIKQYYKDCSRIPLASSAYSFDLDTLRSGTTNILGELAKLKSVNSFTKVYSTTHKSGLTVNCKDAFENHINGPLTTESTFSEFFETVCRFLRFDPSDAAQKTTCKSRINAAHSAMFDVSTGNSTTLLRNIMLSRAIAQSMLEESPDTAIIALSNQSMMLNGLGAGIAADNWIPQVRATVLAIVVGMIPLLLLFIVTPIMGRALQLIVVLLVWITLWGCIDIIVSQIIIDQAYAATDEIKRHQQGIIAFLLAPEGASKALALFGKARTMGIVISSVIAAILFKMSTHGFSTMAGSWSGNVESRGGSAAESAVDPQRHTDRIQGLSNSEAYSSVLDDKGYDYLASASRFNVSSSLTDANMSVRQMQTISGNPGLTANQAGEMSGAMTGGSRAGQISAYMSGAATPSSVASASATTSRTQTQEQLGKTAALRDVSGMSGRGVDQYSRDIAEKSLLSEGGRLDTLNNLMGAYQQANPGMSTEDAWGAVAQGQYADYLANAKTAGYSSDRLLSNSDFEQQKRYAQNDSLETHLHKSGLSMDRFADAGSASQIIHAKTTDTLTGGRDNYIDEATDKNVLNETESLARARTDTREMAERGQTSDQFYGERAAYHTDEMSANLDVINRYVSATDRSQEEVMEMQKLASNNGFVFASEDIQRLQESGAINLSTPQYEAFKNGGHGYLQLDMNNNTVGFIGNRGNSISVSDSLSEDRSSRYASGSKYNLGDEASLQSAQSMLSSDAAFRSTIASAYVDEKGLVPAERQRTDEHTRALTDYINTFTRSDVQDSVVTTGSGSIDLGLGKGGTRKGLGFGGGVSASGNRTELDVYDANRSMVENWLNEAYYKAHRLMREDGYSYNERSSDEYREKHLDTMAQIARSNIVEGINDLKEESIKHTKTTDRVEDNDFEKGQSHRQGGRKRGNPR